MPAGMLIAVPTAGARARSAWRVLGLVKVFRALIVVPLLLLRVLGVRFIGGRTAATTT